MRRTHARLRGFVLSLGVLSVPALGQAKVDFQAEVLPILKSRCFSCHQGKDSRGRVRKPKAGLRLDGKGWILKGSKDNVVLHPGQSGKSLLYTLTALPPDDENIMPAKGKPLTKAQTDLIKRWIDGGAEFGSWTGEVGPDAAVVAAAQESIKPVKLSGTALQAVTELAKGVSPALPQAVQRAAGRKCQVVPVVPGSPLLRVAFVSNESAVGDADLDHLLPLSGHITHLGLGRTKISDRGLDAVAKMSRLTRLDLNRTAVTDQGLAKLAGLRELRYLNLHSTKVTDSGLLALGKLAKLEALYLWNSKVTDAGVQALQKLLPDTKISHKLEIDGTPPKARTGARSRRRPKK
ncbi:MAG: hypothetical protein KDC87_18860 [Planctomycetes bacterium]|nr:hypothetical protein [Planctomycetota bacterium]